MELKDVIDGQIFYCCLPSIEQMSYDDDTPVQPRLKRAKWHDEYGIKVLHLNGFLPETGKIDEDSNATVIVEDGKDIFLDAETAWHEYNRLVIRHVKQTMEEMITLLFTMRID